MITNFSEHDRFFTAAPDMLCIAGFDGYFKELNPVWENALGFTTEELKAKPFIEFVHPEDQEATIAQVRQLRTGEAAIRFENRYLCKDGSYKGLSWSATASLERGLFYAVARNVSEQDTTDKIENFAAKFMKETFINFAISASPEAAQEHDLLHTLMENTPDHIYFKDTESRFIRINKSLADWFGLSHPEDAIGKTDFDFFADEHARTARADEEYIMASGTPLEAQEEKETWPDGRETYVSTTKGPLRNEDGQTVGTFGISRDITAHKHAEDALRESEEKWRSFVENAPNFITLIDLDYTVQFINHTPPQITAEKVIGQSFLNFVPPEHHNDTKRTFEHVRHTGEAASTELKGGVTGEWYTIRVGPIKNDNRVTGFMTIAANITDRVQAEEGFRESETWIRTLIADVPQLIGVVTPDGQMTFLNRAWYQLTNRTSEESLGARWAEAVHPQDLPIVFAKWEQARKDNQPYQVEYRLRISDGSYKTIDSVTIPVHDESGNVINWVGIGTDISERVQARTALQEAKEAAEYASLAKSEFLATMSHELRTPLNAIIGFAEILRDEILGSINAEQQDLISNIHTSGHHLLEMINKILDLSKIEAGQMDIQPENFSAIEALEEVNTVIYVLSNKKQIQLNLKYTQDIRIEADKIKFKQILYNLLSNAIKFTPEGGTVTTQFEQMPLERDIARDALLVRVIDTGIGIDPQDQPKLFQSFTQLDASKSREYEGTGLGLSLTKRLVELHGGEIWVESEKRKGSTFLFTLPLQQHETPTPTSTPPPSPLQKNSAPLWEGAPAPDTPSSNRTILVAEANQRAAQLIGTYLTTAGYSVEYATDGEDAIAKAKAIQPFAIILDIFLPKKDGWHVLKELTTNPNLQGIPLLTVFVTAERQVAYGFSASAHLVKPINKEMLRTSLRSTRLPDQNNSPPRLLLADDDTQTVQQLSKMLTNEGYEVISAQNGKEAIEMARSQTPALIILDLLIPRNAVQVIRYLVEDPKTRNIPIIICTAADLSDEDRDQLNNRIQSGVPKTGYIKADLLNAIKKIERCHISR